MDPLKYPEMSGFMVHFKIFSINGRIFGFAIGTADGIKHGIIEIDDLSYLIVSSERSKNVMLDGSWKRTWDY